MDSRSPAKIRLLLNLIGLAILLSGYVTAAVIWRAQDRLDQRAAPASEADALDPLDSRRDTRQIELYYGKSGLSMERCLEWLQSLTHGRPLARSIVVVSSAAAIVFFIKAARIQDDKKLI